MSTVELSFAAFERRGRERDPEPALFFPSSRGPGHWSWWSFAELAEGLLRPIEPPPGVSGRGAPTVEEFVLGLRRFLGNPTQGPEGAIAELEGLLPESGRREIVVARRPWNEPREAALLLWAAARGHAIVLEPHPAAWATTFAWARPTVLSLAAEEAEPLTEALVALAPRWGARRWLAARGVRLRAVLLESPANPRVEASLRRWTAAPLRPLAAPAG